MGSAAVLARKAHLEKKASVERLGRSAILESVAHLAHPDHLVFKDPSDHPAQKVNKARLAPLGNADSEVPAVHREPLDPLVLSEVQDQWEIQVRRANEVHPDLWDLSVHLENLVIKEKRERKAHLVPQAPQDLQERSAPLVLLAHVVSQDLRV